MSITNQMAKKYFDLVSKISALEKEKQSLAKKMNKKVGSFATQEFVVVVDDLTREFMSGAKEFEECGYDLRVLRKQKLLKSLTYRMIRVRERK